MFIIVQSASTIPVLPGFDHTFAFLREGYQFISSRCDALGTDRFAARLMLKPVICARGVAAAEIFYGAERFTRKGGAMPPTVLRLLQDKGSVQQLDTAAHRHRKSLFVDLLMNAQAEAAFLDIFRAEWIAALDDWERQGSMVLFDEANLVLTRAVCRWVGLSLEGRGDTRMADDLVSMIENAGKISPAVLFALLRRRGTERFVARQVDGMGGQDSVSPLARVTNHHDLDGRLLSTSEATVEIINILRPVVAIGRYIMFVALALHEHPQWKAALSGADDLLYDQFAEEVRRLYPFFPVVGGIARQAFDWDGYRVDEGMWVMLDLFGTNHDARLFPEPQKFDPERNLSWRFQAYDFIPQGGGDARSTHRCPGEQFTVGVMREAARMLVEEMVYSVPEQDLSMPLNSIPAKPRSGMKISKIGRRQMGFF